MTTNEIKAKAYIIGKQLERLDWFNMPAKDAGKWCMDKAYESGADEREAEIITDLAMNFVVLGGR